MGLRVGAGGGMPKIAIGITGLSKILGHSYSIEEPFEDPHTLTGKNKNSNGSVHSIGIPVRPKPYPRRVPYLSF